jgi:DNA-binding MarR family transcriptional regulator
VDQHAETERLQAALTIVRQATARLSALHDRFSPPGGGLALRAVAERLYSERRKRDEHFPPGLFGEPAWDLLLALFMAREDGRDLTLAQAYAAAKVDPADGPALVDRLTAAGMVLRSRAQSDRRCNAVVLTDHAVERLSDYLTDLI